jgi:hypothetical protein
MYVLAVSTPFTRDQLHQTDLLPADHVVDDPNALPDLVQEIFQEQRQD